MQPLSTGYSENCPILCGHSIEEHVDAWAISVLILPQLLDHDLTSLYEVLKRRHDSWIMDPSMGIVDYLHLIPDLISCTLSHTFASVESWIAWCSIRDSGNLSWNLIASSLTDIFNVPARRRRRVLTLTFNWIQVLQSRDVRPYYSDTEHVGLVANRALNRGIVVDTGGSVMKFIGSRSLVLRQHGLRTSTIAGYYFGGGASLLNHACSDCANVIVDYDYGEVETVRNVLEGEPLRVVYNDDDSTLLRDYGIVCHCKVKEGVTFI